MCPVGDVFLRRSRGQHVPAAKKTVARGGFSAFLSFLAFWAGGCGGRSALPPGQAPTTDATHAPATGLRDVAPPPPSVAPGSGSAPPAARPGDRTSPVTPPGLSAAVPVGEAIAGSGGGPSWATWNIPTAPSHGLPHAASYDLSSPAVVLDNVTRLVWQRIPVEPPLSWIQARRTCQALVLAGARDWVLPSRVQLFSILDSDRSAPAIDARAFPNTPAASFWSSSVRDVNPNGAAWFVDFTSGQAATEPTNSLLRVRCVRALRSEKPGVTASAATPRYALQRTFVHDLGSGLTWQRAVANGALSFDQARDHCAALRQGARRPPWRVPTVGELVTLIDEGTHNPAIRAAAFPDTPGELFWTSSPVAPSPPAAVAVAWLVDFQHGGTLPAPLLEAHRVRCVR